MLTEHSGVDPLFVATGAIMTSGICTFFVGSALFKKVWAVSNNAVAKQMDEVRHSLTALITTAHVLHREKRIFSLGL